MYARRWSAETQKSHVPRGRECMGRSRRQELEQEQEERQEEAEALMKKGHRDSRQFTAQNTSAAPRERPAQPPASPLEAVLVVRCRRREGGKRVNL